MLFEKKYIILEKLIAVDNFYVNNMPYEPLCLTTGSLWRFCYFHSAPWHVKTNELNSSSCTRSVGKSEKAENLTFPSDLKLTVSQDVDDFAGRDEDQGGDDAEGHRALQPRKHPGRQFKRKNLAQVLAWKKMLEIPFWFCYMCKLQSEASGERLGWVDLDLGYSTILLGQ